MMKKITRIFLVLMVSTLTIALSACSSEKKESDTKSTSIVVGIQQDLDSLDPFVTKAAGTKEVLFNIFEGLVKPDEDGNLVPAVAKDYTISEDGMKYTFTLKEVKFHNGEKVTAEDVKYSIEKNAGLLDGEEATESALSVIKSVDIIDASTVEINLKEADTELIGFLTVAIVPKDYKNQASKPIGTGPYKFVSYTANQSLVVERFDEYWQERKAYIEKVEFRIVDNTSSVVMDLKSGAIDIYPYLTGDQATELESSGNFNILKGNTNLVQALFLNNAEKPFDNILVRQALCYATDRQGILDMVGNGSGTIIGSGMFPAFGKYYNKDVVDTYTYNIDKAKELLKEAGYENGFDMTIRVPSNYEFHMNTALVVKEQLKKINVNVTIEGIDWSTWLDEVYVGRKFQSTIIGIDSKLAPKDIMSRYLSTGSKNFINYSNAEYDSLLDEAMSTTDDSKKVELYGKLQKILADDAASVYIEDPVLLVAVNKKLTGYKFYPVYVQDIYNIQFEE